MGLSVAEVNSNSQLIHNELRSPFKLSKIFYLKKRRKILKNRELKKIGEAIRSEDTWL